MENLLEQLKKTALLYVTDDLLNEIISKYYEPHRFYHTWENHILPMYEMLQTDKNVNKYFMLTLLFHDVVYDPKKNDNEERSADYFIRCCKEYQLNVSSKGIELIHNAILRTKPFNEIVSLSDFSNKFNEYDHAYINADYEKLITIEKLIFKEYQWVDWNKYVNARVQLLTKLFGDRAQRSIDFLCSYSPKIGLFCGSFKPFHIGHLNILKQAENVFDKVVICQGKNDSKQDVKKYEIPRSLQYHQYIEYDGLLSGFVNSFSYPVTLVRGLRNGADLNEEQNLRTWLGLDKVAYFLSPREFEHVSSSVIRSLKDKYPDLVEQYIVK